MMECHFGDCVIKKKLCLPLSLSFLALRETSCHTMNHTLQKPR